MDMNDRALREIIVGLGGRANGYPRQDGFIITAASEIMATLCVADDIPDLKERVGKIVIGWSKQRKPIRVADLGIQGSIAVLLKDAIDPNLVQTIENTPAFVHGGPFANIAQGANSILATRTALQLADYVITEAGFGFDLGAEKFFDIVCPYGKFCTNAVVLVATVRALKHHGGVKLKELNMPNPEAVAKGLENLGKHLESIQKFGMKSVVAINKFASDSDEELQLIAKYVSEMGFDVAVVDYWGKGSDGGIELAELVDSIIRHDVCQMNTLYDWNDTVEKKVETICREIYGAEKITFTAKAKKSLKRIKAIVI